MITYSDNWADEFDVEGISIFTEHEWNEYKEDAKKYFEKNGSYTFYFGTNQEMYYDSLKDFLEAFTKTKINENEYKVLSDYVGLFGVFPDFDN
jgi:hypothetical protein